MTLTCDCVCLCVCVCVVVDGCCKFGLPWTTFRGTLHSTPLRRTAQFSTLLLPFPATVLLFLCLSGWSSRGILVVFLRPEPEMCTFGLSGCETPAAPPDHRRGSHTTAQELFFFFFFFGAKENEQSVRALRGTSLTPVLGLKPQAPQRKTTWPQETHRGSCGQHTCPASFPSP